MSTVGSVGGTFSPGSGSSSSRGGGGKGPSRVTKAKLRFSGRRGRGRGAGWAEVHVIDWGGGGEEDGMEFDRVFVTLDNGRTFDLTSDMFAGDGDVGADGLHEEKASSQFFLRPNKSSSSSSSSSGGGEGEEDQWVRGTTRGLAGHLRRRSRGRRSKRSSATSEGRAQRGTSFVRLLPLLLLLLPLPLPLPLPLLLLLPRGARR